MSLVNQPQTGGHASISGLDDLALLRESQIIGDLGKGIRGLFPVSRAEWRKGVREKRYPAPAAKLGHMTFWSAREVARFLASITDPAAKALRFDDVEAAR